MTDVDFPFGDGRWCKLVMWYSMFPGPEMETLTGSMHDEMLAEVSEVKPEEGSAE